MVLVRFHYQTKAVTVEMQCVPHIGESVELESTQDLPVQPKVTHVMWHHRPTAVGADVDISLC